MNKKNIILIILILFFILFGYFGYKLFCLYYYNINNITVDSYEKIKQGLSISNTITLKTIETTDNDYLVLNNIKIKNYFSEFEKLDTAEISDGFEKYILNSDKNKPVFWFGETDTCINSFVNDKTLFGTNDKRISNNDLKKFLDKNNITSDVELFKYLETVSLKENNIFTSVKNIKEQFIIKFLTSVAFPVVDSVTLINGSYAGYIFNIQGDIKEVNIIKNNKRYVFVFARLNYFTDEFIEEILNTVVIE